MQSSNDPLIIGGDNFPLDVDPELTFGFAGPTSESVSCKVLSTSLMQVKLSDGYTWATQGGPLFLTKVKFGEHEVKQQKIGLHVCYVARGEKACSCNCHLSMYLYGHTLSSGVTWYGHTLSSGVTWLFYRY